MATANANKQKLKRIESLSEIRTYQTFRSACVANFAMDSYDEVHEVKNGRELSTPELDVSSAIKFEHNDDDDKEEFGASVRNVPEEVS